MTLLICIENPILKERTVIRTVVDPCATHSIMAKSYSDKLQLKLITYCRANVSTLGNAAVPRQGALVEANLFADLNTLDYSRIDLLALEDFNLPLPSFSLTEKQSQKLQSLGLELADPEAANTGCLSTDLLLAQDWYRLVTREGALALPEGLVLTPTWSGSYMLGGSSRTVGSNKELELAQPIVNIADITFYALSPEEEQHTVDRFQNLDALGIAPLQLEISPILKRFLATTVHNGKRYVVKLPWKEVQYLRLPTNFYMALLRLEGWMKKHSHKHDQVEFQKYHQVMSDQIAAGVLEKVQALGTLEEVHKALASNPQVFDKVGVTPGAKAVCYLPWHGVYRPMGDKLRIVYDAAARAYKGAYSLNDCLETGPDLMNSLFHILLQFRRNTYAAKADIEKAFLQVEIDPLDRDALRLLWVEDGVVWIYRFARLPFGLTCSPYILAAVLQRHLKDSPTDHDMTEQILSAFYVDDNIWSVALLSELLARKDVILREFAKAGMVLRKWNSNSEEARGIFRAMGEEPLDQETVLGLRWDVVQDLLSINADRLVGLVGQLPRSKRKFWSFISKVYDPLGFLAPFTTIAKLLTRAVSAACKGWDSKLPVELAHSVGQWMKEFDIVSTIQIPRHVGVASPVSEKLVAFCDASMKALGVCIYLVSQTSDATVSRLYTAKSRITPVPEQTIPRLELTAAVLATNIMCHVRKVMPDIAPEDIYYFTDSADVMYWLYSGSMSWPEYVANRRESILKLSTVTQWRHVATAENPADIPSRGCSLKELKDNDLYWKGPKFLTEGFHTAKTTLDGYDSAYTDTIPEGCQAEVKLFATIVASHDPHSVTDVGRVMDIERFSSYARLVNATNSVLAAVNRLLQSIGRSAVFKTYEQGIGSMTSQAEVLWIRSTQLQHFPDLFTLATNPDAPVASAMRELFRSHDIYLDKELQILRVRTRLQNSILPYSTIYPILLPAKSRFTTLLVLKVHETLGHAGTSQTLAHSRSEFWILRGRQTIQKITRSCNICRKVSGKVFPLPAHPPLPDFRVRKARTFQSIGLDFAGPFTVIDPASDTLSKAYLLLFTCAASRAVHLEATHRMNLEQFLLALQRFMATRGTPSSIESDCARTFIRANKELKAYLDSREVRNYLAGKRVDWHFYVERAPWMGGFIERLNSSFKSIFKRTVRKRVLTFEEFRTFTAYAMSLINDRPMTHVYSEVEAGGIVLTPSMLVHGYNLSEPPPLGFRNPRTQKDLTMAERFDALEGLKQTFWDNWYPEYLKALTERHIQNRKEQSSFIEPRVGDVVLVKDEQVPRRDWKVARIISLTKGDDKRVREVRLLRTACTPGGPNPHAKRSFLRRSPSFLIPLEVHPDFSLESRKHKPARNKPQKSVSFATDPGAIKVSLKPKDKVLDPDYRPTVPIAPSTTGNPPVRRSARLQNLKN